MIYLVTQKLNENYKSILEVDRILSEKRIPHETVRLDDGWKISYPSEHNKILDLIETYWSYGHKEDLMEAAGYCVFDVQGNVDVDEAVLMFERVHEKHGIT